MKTQLNNLFEYRVWCEIKRRCYNENCGIYPYYGGKGISMCSEWNESFDSFLSYMGTAPTDTSIDRIDGSLGYQPGNCRWVDRSTQASNRSVFKNSTTGYSGITIRKSKELYVSRVQVNGKRKYLGMRKSLEEALELRNTYILDNKLNHPIQELRNGDEHKVFTRYRKVRG